jgi:hypothetical protein
LPGTMGKAISIRPCRVALIAPEIRIGVCDVARPRRITST